jgi:hypothetical protein
MKSRKFALLSSTVIPLAVVAGIAAGGTAVMYAPAVVAPAYATCNPCSPCAAKSPCSPCAAASPCSPCGAAGVECAIPRLQAAAAKSPCNPCAAKNPCNPCAAANACNPCAAKKACSPCNPCAAANPCNPCATANPCAAANPCNPCAAGSQVELTDAEAKAAYDCLFEAMKAAYAKSDNAIAGIFAGWQTYSSQAYQSATHGGRYVMNFADERAKSYGTYEQGGPMPTGSQLAKPSFEAKPNGQVVVGPLFIMEKMQQGFSETSGDWRYTMVMPNGAVFGTTNGAGADKVEFCIGCHQAGAERDSLLFMPEDYRATRN